jgi:hypothetical protein
MIKLAQDNVVWWRVNIPDRTEDGEIVEQPVRFRLRIYTREELKQRGLDRGNRGAAETAEAMRRLITVRTRQDIDAALADAQKAITRMAADDTLELEELRSRIVGWNADDIRGPDDEPVSFSEQLRDALLADEARYQALSRGLLEASHGARPKNSLPGPAGSPAVAQGGGESSYGASQAAPR